MGKSQSKKDIAAEALNLEYINFLKRKQKRFIRSQKEDASSISARFSFVSDAGTEEVDWKIFYVDFLEQHADTCFWAAPMLE